MISLRKRSPLLRHVTDDEGVVAWRKGARQHLWTPGDKQARKESAEPHVTSSDVRRSPCHAGASRGRDTPERTSRMLTIAMRILLVMTAARRLSQIL